MKNFGLTILKFCWLQKFYLRYGTTSRISMGMGKTLVRIAGKECLTRAFETLLS